jgi:hypothetical protein
MSWWQHFRDRLASLRGRPALDALLTHARPDQSLPERVREILRERKLPLVLLGDNSDPTLSQVVVDDFAGARLSAGVRRRSQESLADRAPRGFVPVAVNQLQVSSHE